MKISMLYRGLVLTALAVTARCALAADPSLTLGAVSSHDPWDGCFDVPYTLANIVPETEYKVAFELSAAGKSAAVTNAARHFIDGVYTNTLDTAELFGKRTSDMAARIRVVLIAVKPEGSKVVDADGTTVGALGDVMVIDVSGGPDAPSFPVTYHDGVDFGSFNCDVYKTTKIVLRKVASGSAYYVKPGETNELTNVDRLAPAKDYYIGLFPVTEAQYANVMGEGSVSAKTPKGGVSWEELRGGVATTTAITSASAAGFFQKLCARCGLNGFDLPTEVQWEIAARAGSTTMYGSYISAYHEVQGNAENVGDFAVSNSVAEVGSKCPNAWGLYDTAGNVAELCRDDYVLAASPADAETPYSGTGVSKVARGGDYNSPTADLRLTYRNTAISYMGSARNGFRIVRVCP